MLSPVVREEWRKRISDAALRYEDAKCHVGHTAIERLILPRPDGVTAHNRALQEEMLALREYVSLLVEFSRLLAKE
jgi:hypothetical protein